MKQLRVYAVALGVTAAASGAPEISFCQPAAHFQMASAQNAGVQSVTLGAHRVRICTRVVGHGAPEATSPPWGAGEKDATWRLITSLEIWLGKDRIEAPRSAFADLANPNLVKLKEMPHEFLITIVGGDAAYSYQADIWVSGKRVVRRVVRSGEFPDNYWQETRYVDRFPSGK